MSLAPRLSLVFFFLSGITGLVYEVLWTRRLTLTFGHTTLAVSTVLTAYMMGLALGSLMGGRFADKKSADPAFPPGRFLSLYGVLEFFVGIWALLSLPLLGLVEKGYLTLSHQGWSGSPLHLACFFGSVLVLLPPTVAMGATLPVMSRLLVRQNQDLGSLLARIYGINTLGAFLGAGLAGFILLPTLGLLISLCLAAAVNLAIGLAAWYVGGRESAAERSAEEPSAEPPGAPGLGWLLPVAFGLAGVTSMTYQIGWTRGLALSLGSSVYAFSAILTTFLAGLGLGSLLYPRLARGRQPRLEHLAWLQIGVGLLGAATIPILGQMPRIFFHLAPSFGTSFGAVLSTEVALSALVLGGPTFLMGLAFPLTSHLYTQDMRLLGRSIGEVYGANTLGCIAGSFLAGFVLLPTLGTQHALKLAVVVNLLVGALVLFAAGRGRSLATALVLAGLALVALLPRWDPGVMASGVVLQALRHQGMSESELRRTLYRPPAFYKDGLSCLVSANVFSDGWRSFLDMRVNGKVDASLEQLDRQTMYLTGYIPGVLHHGPEDVVVIGLGGGMTVEALANLPGVKSIDCAELEGTVVEVNRLWQDYNGHVLQDPRVRMVITDGRTYVLGSPRKFDIIASEPSNVWIAGVANLFTREFYGSCRAHLKPRGIMCQWLQAYGLSRECLGYVLHSFFDVFPNGMVWQSNFGDLILIGSNEPVQLDLERLRQLYTQSPGMQRNFFAIDLFRPEEMMGHFVMTREQALEIFGQSPFNTDDLPLLEFHAPLRLYDKSSEAANFELMRRTNNGALPPGVAVTPEHLLLAAHAWLNLGDTTRVGEFLKTFPNALLLARWLAASNAPAPQVQAAFLAAQGNSELGAGVPPWLYARWLLFKRDFAAALPWLGKAAQAPPSGGRLEILYWLGASLMGTEQPERAAQVFEQATKPPLDSRAFTGLGRALLRLRQPEPALNSLKQAIDRNPADIEAFLAMGEALTLQKRYPEAAEALNQAYRLMPDHADLLVALGVLALHQGQLSEAIERFREAAELQPAHPVARKALTELGQPLPALPPVTRSPESAASPGAPASPPSP